MKRLCTLVSKVIITASLFGQVPSGFKYQAVLRDASGNVRVTTNVSIDVAILQGSAIGTQIFVETHLVTTNEFGLVNMEIGSKNPTGFNEIDWSAGPYFIKINVDNIEMGTSQLLSVPYALYAKTAENGFSGDYNDLSNTPDFNGWDNMESDDFSGSYIDLTNKPSNIDEDKTDDVNLTGNQTIYGNKAYFGTITVPSPVNNSDAVNKSYVDSILRFWGLIPDNYSGNVTDIEGNIYKTVTIGTQTWMAENLKTTKYNDGTDIPNVTDGTVWIDLTTPAYCWYNNEEADFKNMYGALYNWYTVNTDKLCPAGWHMSTNAEWTTLITYLGGEDVAGGKLKESGTTHWSSPNIGATNETGFTALPGGSRYDGGIFRTIGNYGYWWGGPGGNETDSGYLYMNYNYGDIVRSSFNKQNGYSVRCIRD